MTPKSKFPGTFRQRFRPTTSAISTAPPELDEDLLKLGRTTGFTCGVYNAIKEVKLEDWKEEDPDHKQMVIRRNHIVISSRTHKWSFLTVTLKTKSK